MYDIALWLGGVNIFLVLAIGIVGIVFMRWMIRSLLWVMAHLRGSRDRLQATDTPKVGDLSSELKTVTNWYQLGICLGLQTHELKRIEHDHQGNERRKHEVLDLWLQRKPDAGWRDVVSALEQMKENRVAESIRQKYVRGEAQSIQEDQGTVVEITQNNQRKMEAKFATLLMNTCRTLKNKPINVEDFQMFLTGYFPSECIPKSSSIHETFEVITRHKLWDFWNYRPLYEIVQGFLADEPDVKSWIESYKRDLISFKVTTKLIDHIAETDYIPPSEEEQPARYDQRYYKKLSFKLEMKFTHHTLVYIDDLWNEYAELYGLPPYVALLDCIRKGCVSIVWLIPSHLAPQIRSTTPLSGDFYRKHEITRVELGEECIYQEEEEEEKVHVFREQVNMLQRQLQWTPLHTAARQGDVNTFKSETLSDINIKDKNGWTPLHIAVREGQECIVEYLIREGADVNIKDNCGMTPLHVAAERGHSEIVSKYFGDKEVDINIKDNDGLTPLHMAAKRGFSYLVEYFIGKEADINITDNKGMTPLHMAAEGGRFYFVKRFADHEADINIKDNSGRTPLHVAAREGQKHTVECLIEKGADTNIKDNDGMTPLHVVAETGGQLIIVNYLIDQRADINIKNNKRQTPLHIAVREGNKPTVECLVKKGANINIQDNDGMAPLHLAAERGRFHIVEYLVDREAGQEIDIDMKDNNEQTALHIAARYGQQRTVNSLVEGGANVNIKDNKGKTPLEVANESGHEELAETLGGLGSLNGAHQENIQTLQGRRTTNFGNELKEKDDDQKEVQTLREQVRVLQEQLQWTDLHTAAGQGDVDALKAMKVTDINVKDKKERTPLHIAIREGHEHTVKCLIREGADINIKDSGGMTPLHMAAERGRFYLVKNFVNQGADINSKDNAGRTPLHMAVREGQKHTVECLIEQRADVNIKDNDGMTPLHVAAERGVNSDIIEYLVHKSANINIKDNYGRTPLHMAVGEGQEHAVECLVENKANVSIKDNNGISPFHVAAERGRFYRIVDHLTHCGEEAINIKDNNGQTPLHVAARDGQLYTVKHLVKNKADVNSKDNNGNTPCDMAKKQGHMEIVDFLTRNGGQCGVEPEQVYTPVQDHVYEPKEQLQIYHPKKEAPLQHINPLTTENEKLRQEIEKLQRQLHHNHSDDALADMETTDYLRGMTVIGETNILVTNQAQSFRWKGYGLKLHVPQEVLPPGLEHCRLYIKVGLSGEFKLPQNTSFVSAVYWIDSKPRCKFSKPIRMEIQHCSKSHESSELSFVRAKCSQEFLPYTFNLLEGEFYSLDISSYGSVNLSHFSLLGVIKKGGEDPQYCAGLYYIRSKLTSRRVHFVVTKNLEASRTAVSNYLKGAAVGAEIHLEFENKSVELGIPSKGIVETGWAIKPLTPPVVTKDQVDTFEPGKLVPRCQLRLDWVGNAQPTDLCYQVPLNGAKEPFTFITIESDINALQQPSPQSVTMESNQDLHIKYPAGLNDKPKLPDLMDEVAAQIPAKWHQVGIALNLRHSELECLPASDSLRCFSSIFDTWMKQELKPHTWLTIITVLQTPAVGESHLAKVITSKLACNNM